MTPHRIPDLRAFLTGCWAIDRRLVDRRDGRSGTFTGEGLYAETAEGLHYRETGELSIGSHRDDAFREYRLILTGTGTADVLFPDGRYFHALDLTAGHWDAEHFCGDDAYRGTFGVLDDDRWTVRWTVEGPAKAQRIENTLMRIRQLALSRI